MPLVCQAAWEGRILYRPRGDAGFGYDPLFLVPEYNCSSAELPPDVKNSISHRARASAALLAALRSQ
jgi:XTP/dITP diphosphohydrolase